MKFVNATPSLKRDGITVGIQNYVFTLPLTMLERERKVRLNPVALEKAKKFAPAAPINQIGHMKTLATADDVMPYTPNNDTVYSGAVLELADEDHHPDSTDNPDRYWSVEVADVIPRTFSTSAHAQRAVRAETTRL